VYQLGFIDARTDKKQGIADYEKASRFNPASRLSVATWDCLPV